jgi:hypothetical protein
MAASSRDRSHPTQVLHDDGQRAVVGRAVAELTKTVVAPGDDGLVAPQGQVEAVSCGDGRDVREAQHGDRRRPRL